MSRPYINCSVFELQTLVAQHRDDQTVLSTILTELNNRTTPSSRALKEEVRRLLGLTTDLLTPPATFGPGSLFGGGAAPSAVEPPPATPSPAQPVTQTEAEGAWYEQQPHPQATDSGPPTTGESAPTHSAPTPLPPPPKLTEPEAMMILQLEGPQTWLQVEEQRRKRVLGIFARRGEDGVFSSEDLEQLQCINAAALTVFDSRRAGSRLSQGFNIE